MRGGVGSFALTQKTWRRERNSVKETDVWQSITWPFFVASLTFNEEQLQQRYTGIAQHGPGEPGGAASNEARGRDFPPVPLLFPGWKERERKESRDIKRVWNCVWASKSIKSKVR